MKVTKESSFSIQLTQKELDYLMEYIQDTKHANDDVENFSCVLLNEMEAAQ